MEPRRTPPKAEGRPRLPCTEQRAPLGLGIPAAPGSARQRKELAQHTCWRPLPGRPRCTRAPSASRPLGEAAQHTLAPAQLEGVCRRNRKKREREARTSELRYEQFFLQGPRCRRGLAPQTRACRCTRAGARWLQGRPGRAAGLLRLAASAVFPKQTQTWDLRWRSCDDATTAT